MTTAKVAGSVGLMPNSSEDIKRVTANAATSPQVTPPPVSSIAWRTKSLVSSRCCAPRALRMPISRLRCDTKTDNDIEIVEPKAHGLGYFYPPKDSAEGMEA